MHGISLLKRWLQRNGCIGHRARIDALLRGVDAALRGCRLSLTELGRHRAGHGFVKHHIKAIDRLLGNEHLHRERFAIYASMARVLLKGVKRPVIIVDWADCELERQVLILKAALPIRGRAFTLYEEAHPIRRYNSPRTHRRFLRNLQRLLPDNCQPVIVTDAGFRGPWFRDVEAFGWHWVGRIRNQIKYFCPHTKRWRLTRSLYTQATSRIRYLGWLTLAKRKRYSCNLYLVRAYHRGPGRPRKRGNASSNKQLYRILHRTPWLIASSLPHQRGSARLVKRLYTQRMQIEETFRDLKSHRWGLALRYARTARPERLEILLLIAVLATLVMWLVGIAAKSRGWLRRFQANTIRHRDVLSTVFLGRAILKNDRFRSLPLALAGALRQLQTMLNAEAEIP
jgi:Transposase DDE domain